ncbi:MAG: WD40/YVTN/BNR-like repeat-containing protein [Bacillota bacterium]
MLDTGVIYQTKDGCKTWHILKLPVSDKKMISIIPHTSIAAIRFLDTRRGIVVLYAEKPEVGFYIFETEDGGRRWREEKLPFRVKAGSPFLSRDGKYLTINDIFNNQILLFRHLSVR